MSKLISETLSAIKNAEARSKNELIRKPVSKLLLEVLKIIKREGYISDFEVAQNSRGGEVTIKLQSKINNIGIISPNFPVKYYDLEKYEKRFLPAKNFGVLILTTNKGVITNNEAKASKTGGKLLAYVY